MLQLAPIPSTASSATTSSSSFLRLAVSVHRFHHSFHFNAGVSPLNLRLRHPLPTPKKRSCLVLVGKEDTELRASTTPSQVDDEQATAVEADPQDLEYVNQIKSVCGFPFIALLCSWFHCFCRLVLSFSLFSQVLELLRNNRDMLFSEVFPSSLAPPSFLWRSGVVLC